MNTIYVCTNAEVLGIGSAVDIATLIDLPRVFGPVEAVGIKIVFDRECDSWQGGYLDVSAPACRFASLGPHMLAAKNAVFTDEERAALNKASQAFREELSRVTESS